MAISLVTGASGFIGGHLVEKLVSAGNDVRCLVRSTSNVELLRNMELECHVADVAGTEDLSDAVAGVAVVYHVAGVTHTPRPGEQIRVNRDGVSRILEACAQQRDPPRFVLISSVAATGPVPRGEIRQESDPPSPVSEYGRSKLAGESAAREYASRVPIVVIRPGIVFGPRDHNVLPLFQSVSRLGIHAVPTLRPPRLSLIHVADLVEILVRSAQSATCIEPVDGGPLAGQGYYFACAPEYPDYSELGSLLAAAVGRKRVLRLPLPGLMPWIVAASNEAIGRLRGRSSALRIDKIREAKASCWACSCEAVRDLGFAPPKSIAERLKETALWYRNHGYL